MDNTFYFLRHAETKPDRNMPASKWVLSEEGMRAAEQLAESDIFNNVDIIISSVEEKAYQTAAPIAERLGKDIIRIWELNELDRDAGGFLEKEEFDRTVNFAMTNLDKSLNGWETGEHALERFSKVVDKIEAEYENKKILIVAHGCVINLYFAKLIGKLDEVNDRWKKTSFCSWGAVKDGKVIKDIVD